MHIVVFSPIRFDYLHQRPQKLAEQFLALGATVTFVQPTGFRNVWMETHPIRFLVWSLSYNVFGTSLLSRVEGRKQVQTHFRVLSLPVTVPANRFDSSWLEALTARAFRAFVGREIQREVRGQTLAIFQNPFWGRVVEARQFEKICYDCMDDISIYAGRASLARFTAYEQALLDTSDLIVTTAARLEARLREKTSKPIHRIPNGVDYEWFRTRASASRTPTELADVPRPIVGYVGSIAGWLDYELIVAVARRLPDVSFVFVGPAEHEGRVKQLLRSPNIFWLGRKPYEEIPSYISAFTVCSIPFRQGDIAQTTNPVKVFEYFALGKPVVATPLVELEAYTRDRLVLFGDSAPTFADAVRYALAEESEECMVKRARVAAEHSWHNHARRFMELLGFRETAPR